MAKSSKLPSGRASLGALGEYWRRLQFWARWREQVKLPQPTVKYQPGDKLLEARVSMRCGAQTIAQGNVTVPVEAAVPRACGRPGGAEQSTRARRVPAGTAATVIQLAGLSWA
jgi:hypothetical protein